MFIAILLKFQVLVIDMPKADNIPCVFDISKVFIHFRLSTTRLQNLQHWNYLKFSFFL